MNSDSSRDSLVIEVVVQWISYEPPKKVKSRGNSLCYTLYENTKIIQVLVAGDLFLTGPPRLIEAYQCMSDKNKFIHGSVRENISHVILLLSKLKIQ